MSGINNQDQDKKADILTVFIFVLLTMIGFLFAAKECSINNDITVACAK